MKSKFSVKAHFCQIKWQSAIANSTVARVKLRQITKFSACSGSVHFAKGLRSIEQNEIVCTLMLTCERRQQVRYLYKICAVFP